MRIGFVASHPGSVNTLTPLINRFRELGATIFEMPLSNYALTHWKTKKLYMDNNLHLKYIPRNLDVLFYSPHGSSELEISLPEFCKTHNIISIATVDIFWSDERGLKSRFISEPDYIITPDYNTAKIINGFKKKSTVLPLGNPHFEQYNNCTNETPSLDFLDKKDLHLSFISYPECSKEFSNTATTSLTMFHDFYNSLLDRLIKANYNRTFTINICLHPRENADKFEVVIKQMVNEPRIKIRLNKRTPTALICKKSDLIVGYESTVLLEQLLMGKPVLYLSEEDSVAHILKSKTTIKNKINKTPYVIDLPRNVIDNIVDFVYNEFEPQQVM